MYIYWFSPESGYRRWRRRRRQRPTHTSVQPLGRHIANKLTSYYHVPVHSWRLDDRKGICL